MATTSQKTVVGVCHARRATMRRPSFLRDMHPRPCISRSHCRPPREPLETRVITESDYFRCHLDRSVSRLIRGVRHCADSGCCGPDCANFSKNFADFAAGFGLVWELIE